MPIRHDATELAGSDVSVYTLMKLLGHESMTTRTYQPWPGRLIRDQLVRWGLLAGS